MKNELADEVFWNEPPEIVNPLLEAKPPSEAPPTKVEVAVDVAWIAATYGVVDATTFPALSSASKTDGLTFERLSVVPELNVSVPEVKLSEVSLLKNEVESIPSSVVASPPLDERHDPSGIWKQPAESAIPFAKVEVADPVTVSEEVAVRMPTVVEPTVKLARLPPPNGRYPETVMLFGMSSSVKPETPSTVISLRSTPVS